MVSTRQMSNGHCSSPDGSEHSGGENGPSKSTRNSVTAGHSSHSQPQCSKAIAAATGPPVKPHFLELPPEIIQKIFGYLTYKNICQLRFVCTRFDRICGHILNSTFLRLQHHLLDKFHEIKKRMPRRESARRNHHLASESDIVETLHMRLTLLQMSLGKHIERKHICFFPGEILDEVLHILDHIKTTPKLGRPYKITDELFDLSTMAMEYFKERIEPDLPEIAYFTNDFMEMANYSKRGKNYMALDSYALDMEEAKDDDSQSHDVSSMDGSPEGTPQSNIVLRKGIRKIKQGMKRYNSQLTILRQDVRSCKQKATEQQKLMSEQQKQLAEQQKQILEYASRMDENEKKNEEISRKFSTLLQELNKCKTELQYWRSKSPATPLLCNSCGVSITSYPEEVEALVNQELNPEGLGLEEPLSEFVPIPGASGEPSSQVLSPTETEEVPPVKVETYVPNTSTKSTKRKLDDIKERPTRLSASKKGRRIVKARSNKRSKI